MFNQLFCLQMMNTDSTSEVSEVEFAELYSTASNKLQCVDRRQSHPAAVTRTKSQTDRRRVSVKDLGKMAAAGRAAMAVTTIVDELLTSNRIPRFADGVLKSVQGQKTFAQNVNARYIPTMIITDLTVTSCRSLEPSISLVQLAKNRLMVDCGADDPRGVERDQKSDLLGFCGFLDRLSDMLGFVNDRVSKESFLAFMRCSATELLTSSFLPLLVTDCEKYVTSLCAVEQAYRKSAKVLQDSRAEEKQAFLRAMRAGYQDQNCATPERKTSATDPRILHNAIKSLLRALVDYISPNGVLASFERYVSTGNVPTSMKSK